MIKNTVSPQNDPMGVAIADYFNTSRACKLRVMSDDFDEDEIPVAQLFRTYKEMSTIEQKALQIAQGKILDVGAGSGCHSLALQEMGKDVTAIEISTLSCEIMEKRGVDTVINANIFNETFVGNYDTILMLMNGSGIIGKLENMELFFNRMKELLSPGGKIIMDSSDLKYLFEDEDGSYLIDIAGDYYGEIRYSMKYKDIEGEEFDWLYIDYPTLSLYASQYGFKTELIQEGEHYDYLASLSVK
jgi:SAM-dependent methyltransferase